MGFDVGGNIARRQRCTALFGLKRVDLLVQRAYAFALFVVQRGPVHGAGQVVFGVFALAAGVDQGVKFAIAGDHVARAYQGQAHAIIFERVGQTLSSRVGWAASRG